MQFSRVFIHIYFFMLKKKFSVKTAISNYRCVYLFLKKDFFVVDVEVILLLHNPSHPWSWLAFSQP